MALVGTIHVAAALGPDGFGVIGFATALVGWFSFTLGASFQEVGAREVARNPSTAHSVAWGVIAIRLAVGIVAFAVVAACAAGFDKPSVVKIVIILSGLTLFTTAGDLSWVLKGLERAKLASVALLVGQGLTTLLLLACVRRESSIVLVPLAQIAGELTVALVLGLAILRRLPRFSDVRLGIGVLRMSANTLVARMLRTLMVSFDVVLLGILVGERAVGLYSAPYRVCFAFMAIAAAMNSAYLPTLARAAAKGAAEMRAVAERSLEVAAAIAAPILVGGTIVAAPLLVALFGPEYEAGAPAFRFLLVSVSCIFLFGTVRNVLLVRKRVVTEIWIVGVAGILNVLLNFVAIPRFGATGAGLVTAATEALCLLMGIVALNRFGVRLRVRTAARPLLAALLMGLAVSGLGADRGLALRILVGCALYPLLLLAIRGVPRDLEPYLRALGVRKTGGPFREAG